MTMGAVQNPPLPDPGPADGTHEGDAFEIGEHTAEASAEKTEEETEDNMREKK